MYSPEITQASNFVKGVDQAFLVILGISFLFLIGLTVVMIWFLYRYNRKRNPVATQIHGSTTLEIIWTVVPFVLTIVMFYYGWAGFSPMRNVPGDAMNITAIGRMWEWEFDYGNGMKSADLVLPVNKPVRVALKSEDVNHSLFIPAFRVKEDVIPGYDNYLWFIPTFVGESEILCTEYCGLLHSSMLAKAKILKQEDYDAWYDEFKSTAAEPEPDGYLLLRNTGCIACHSLDGARLVGPSFLGLYGKERLVTAGGAQVKVTADETYILNSIYDPDGQVVEGFAKGLMKSYKELLNESDITTITNYLKTLNETK